MSNSIVIPISQLTLFAHLVEEFTLRNLTFEVETTAKDFHIKITGCNRAT